MQSILVFFPYPTNTGYAIDSYEVSFVAMARELCGDDANIHFGFTDISGPEPKNVPEGVELLRFDPASSDPSHLAEVAEYIRRHRIDFAFGIDQPVTRPSFRALRDGGIRRFVSYWGAPMGSVNRGVKLALKRLQVRLSKGGPDHYVFESRAMADTATLGRGIPASDVSVVYLGVDPDKYRPREPDPGFLEAEFGIAPDRRVMVFSGHMEERKGVAVLMRAAVELADARGRSDFHWLILGNRAGEERRFQEMLAGTKAAEHVTFGGYRSDVPDILPHCMAGAIASTGWDSFTVSSLEMAAAGLPLIVSDLQGLKETVEPRVTGYTFPPGDEGALADLVEGLLDDPDLRSTMSRAARERILAGFTREVQVARLVDVCRRVGRA